MSLLSSLVRPAGPAAPIGDSLLPSLGSRLSLEAAEALLQHLVKSRWSRLSSEYDDPLGMLFSNRVRQWTAGWDSQARNLFLLVWETQSWQDKAVWCLYKNGEMIYQEAEGDSKVRNGLCHKLLESKQLPFASFEQFTEPLCHYRYRTDQREHAAKALLATILARPEIFDHLREPLFAMLETDLGNPDWPLLEVMKIHRVGHKNVLVWLFRQFVETGLIRTLRENARLDQALTLLQEDYFQYGYKVSPLFRPAYDQAYDGFRRLITDGNWRIRLRMKVPQS